MNRRGTMLLEVAVSVSLVVVALASVAQILAIAARQRHETHWREVAIMEVGNALERISQMPYQQLTTGKLESFRLSPRAEAELPEGTVRVSVLAEEAWPDAKRIVVAVDWVDSAGLRVQPVELTGWSFAPRQEASE